MRLNIYDIADSDVVAGVNNMLLVVGTGAFHAGVEVYCSEWSYGNTPGSTRSGIFCVSPRACDAHKFRESIVMGETRRSEKEVRTIIDALGPKWHASGYDLLRRNCCHFSDELCIQLGVGPVPEWVTSLAGVGALLQSFLFENERGEEEHRCGVQCDAQVQCHPLQAHCGRLKTGDPLAILHPQGKPRLPSHGPDFHREPLPAFDSMPLPVIALAAADPIDMWSHSEESWSLGHEDTVPCEWPEQDSQDSPAHGIPGFDHRMLPISSHTGRKDLRSGAQASPSKPWAGVEAAPLPRDNAANDRQDRQREGDCEPQAEEYREGDALEMYSGTAKASFPGVVEQSRDGVALVAYTASCSIPAVDQQPLRTGDTVEIYNASSKTWCSCSIVEVTPEVATARCSLPGGRVQLRRLPLSHEHVRALVEQRQDVLQVDEAAQVCDMAFTCGSLRSDPGDKPVTSIRPPRSPIRGASALKRCCWDRCFARFVFYSR